jgi:hypothetical protein
MSDPDGDGTYTGTWRTMIFTEGGIYNITIGATDTEGNEALAKPCKIEIASEATGTISVTSEPSGATTHLEGYAGPSIKTPHTFSNVPVGIYTLELSLDGHEDWSTNVYVMTDETSYVHAILDWAAP